MEAAVERKQEGLQALRGIAVMLVLVQHLMLQAGKLVPAPSALFVSALPGAVGVFLFFALSAYLIAGKAADPPAKFAMDRVRRIFPAFWIAVAVDILVAKLLGGPHGVTWQFLLLLPFGEMPSLPGPYWTLYFELLFYAIVLALAMVSPRLVAPCILVWAITAFIFQDRPYGNGHYLFPTWYHLCFPVFALYFAAGVLARYRFDRNSNARWFYGILAAVAFLGAEYVADTPFVSLAPGSRLDARFLIFGVGTFCAVRAAVLWRPRGITGQVLKMLGDMSYGIYLVHLPVLFVGVALLTTFWLPDSFWFVFALLFVWTLPFGMLFGRLDVYLQSRLKNLESICLGLRDRELRPESTS